MEREMKSIWYFVGLMLLAMGIVVFASGIYYYFSPERNHTVLGQLHADIWWGAIIIAAGAIFFFTNRNASKKEN
jgi:predicted membrane channel-forming protein YqfA (hemolysin III family)